MPKDELVQTLEKASTARYGRGDQQQRRGSPYMDTAGLREGAVEGTAGEKNSEIHGR